MIGVDVGGANLKVAVGSEIHIHYCPLWEGAPLGDLLLEYAGEKAAVVMSGELADCFRSKLQGIEYIVQAVEAALPGALFYGTDAAFHPSAMPQLAAANWLASADYLRYLYPDGVLVDMGSTTTDIVPLSRFNELLGLSDLKRLQKGYLIYTGLLRTNVATLLQEVEIEGVRTATSSEYFSVSDDAHRILGHITEEAYACPPPDGSDKSEEGAMRRLARVVCSDLDEIGREGAMQIAEAFWEKQRGLIAEGIERVKKDKRGDPVLMAGIGSSLLAREIGGIDLREVLGEVSDALPAYAVREVAVRTGLH